MATVSASTRGVMCKLNIKKKLKMLRNDEKNLKCGGMAKTLKKPKNIEQTEKW